jgi:hypothetical protein
MEWLEGLGDEAFSASSGLDRRVSLRAALLDRRLEQLRAIDSVRRLAATAGRPPAGPRSWTVEVLTRSVVEQIRFLRRNLEEDIAANIVRNIRALWAARSKARKPALGGASVSGSAAGARRPGAPDGVHFERSPAYHAQVLADLTECAAALPRVRPAKRS